MREHFPELVFDTVIPRNVRIGEAPSFGRPVIHHDPHCAGAGRLLRAWPRRWPPVAEPTPRDGPRPGGDPAGVRRAPASGRELRELPVELIEPNPTQPRTALRRGGARRARRRRSPSSGVLQPLLVRPLRRRPLRAGRRRAPLARRAAAGLDAVPGDRRATATTRRALEARADREHGPRGPQPGRGGARLRRAGRGARPHARRRSAAASAAAASRSRT